MKNCSTPHHALHVLFGWLWALVFALCGTQALAQVAARNFDHVKTGFALTGVHKSERCESCHINGIFKGTPKDCATCHTSGSRLARSNVVKPQQHVPTQMGCETCHGTQTFTGANFSHVGVTAGTCASCHSGSVAPGKPSTHFPTQASCDACHSTGAWRPASKFDHNGVVTGTCVTCHNGSKATGKPALHMPVSASQACDDCHKSFGGWKPTAWNHTQTIVTNQCATCHTGGYPPADGKSATHIPYQALSGVSIANCDTCHKGGFSTWTPAKFHANVSVVSQCATCHNGNSPAAIGKPNTPVHNGVTNCESCHKSTTSFKGAKVDHGTFTVATNCTNCHNGSTATGKSGTHIPVGATNCVNCHSTSGWKPSQWNHSQTSVANQCSTCHSGANPPADGPSANHIPYKTLSGVSIANCDTCHKGGYASWNPGKFHGNVSVSSQCATCHLTGAYGLTSKPATAIHSTVTGNCESCHKSTSGWAAGAKVDHSTFTVATNCANCHNGSAATGTSATHIPVAGANCTSCHTTNGWRPTLWNHTQMPVANQCSTCHSGSFPPADGPNANHIPYKTLSGVAIANCDTCHKGGYASWNPGKFHGNVSVSSQCATCHLTGAYGLTSKPASATHAAVTGNCESCHKSTSGWATGAKVDHSTFTVATNCASCHNGSPITGKSATHIPVGATNCINCHNTTGWSPTKWNHTQTAVAGQCSTCHTGSFPPADGLTANHVPYKTLSGVAITNCDTCHKGGYASWNPGKFHGNVSVSSQCATCHLTGAYGLTSKPATAIHSTVTGNCESCHKSTSGWAAGAKVDHSTFTLATNCASCHNGSAATGKSGTHIPVGATNCASCHSTSGWLPSTWNHTQVTVVNQCSTCHSGANPPADGPTANHIPYKTLSGVAITNCDTCHKGGYASWNPGKFHGNVSVTSQCATCHLTGAYGLTSKPASAIHASVTGNCESCHKSTSSWSSGTKVDHSTFTLATNCASCHNGSAATGKSGTHIPVGATNCINCHSTTGWLPSKWNHTQVTVTNQCSTCHTGGYPPADGRSANHIPYQTLSGVAIANCDSCHKSGYAAWAPAKFHGNVSVTSQCATCHLTGTYGLTSKPATAIHSTVTGNCESCHKSTSSWSSGTKVDHSTFTVATNCASCHNGSAATGKSGTHIPVGATNCINCHSTTGWLPSKWNHTQVTVTNQCSTCHTGGYPPADGRPANHIPYQTLSGVAIANCDSCHKAGYASWNPGKFHGNVSVSSQCATCHLTGVYGLTSKPATATHSTVTGNCESCHKSTTSWLSNVSYTHAANNAVGSGTCDTCHTGSPGLGKPASHIPVPAGTAKCDACHKSQVSFGLSVTMNHSAVSTATCKSCHNGSYTSQGATGALAKPANHIPEAQLINGAAMDCNACHIGTTSWGSQRMNHNSSLGNGAGWCKSCHATGTSYLGSMEKKSLNHRNKTPAPTDCSQSGCHRPLGNTGASFSKWD